MSKNGLSYEKMILNIGYQMQMKIFFLKKFKYHLLNVQR